MLCLGRRAGPVHFPDAYRLVDALHGRHGAPCRRCAGGIGIPAFLPVGDDILVGSLADTQCVLLPVEPAEAMLPWAGGVPASWSRKRADLYVPLPPGRQPRGEIREKERRRYRKNTEAVAPLSRGPRPPAASAEAPRLPGRPKLPSPPSLPRPQLRTAPETGLRTSNAFQPARTLLPRRRYLGIWWLSLTVAYPPSTPSPTPRPTISTSTAWARSPGRQPRQTAALQLPHARPAFTYPPFAACSTTAFLTEPQSMMLITVIIGVLSYVCAYALSYARSPA